ncbi:ATP-binding Cassette (ABC) Superfamily [Thraustotheca clavata]|uniref:ATP-binding Cassette (ABC) Superfamily n=1 Tax=Thraustotheca clavata TaxID=74557 RepID=A0A1V9ZXN4_9STRA|nr:ATP-binding Cassette (ABC) Superfamily [Thraustotheca clavata]
MRPHIRTLLWKNTLLKRRHPIKLGFELLFPVLFIVILGILKNQAANIDVPAGWTDNMESTFNSKQSTAPTYSLYQGYPVKGTSTPKFVATEVTLSGILLRMASMSYDEGRRLDQLSSADLLKCKTKLLFYGAVSLDTSSPNAIPQECGGKIVPYKLAIVPDTTYTRSYFAASVSKWYPRVPLGANATTSPTIPCLNDSIIFYSSESELEDYVSGGNYGQDLNHPKIFAAIVFSSVPSTVGGVESVAYAVRLNSTSSDVPSTSGKAVDAQQKALIANNYKEYATNGFLTLQTLVTRFLACHPAWDGSKPGNCTFEDSIAPANSAMDQRFLVQVQNDMTLVKAVGAYNTMASSYSLNPIDLANLPAATSSLLLTPLRQMPQPYFGSSVMAYPSQAYTASPFFSTAGGYFSFVFVVSYVQLVTGIVVVLVKEKETKSREMMKIIGVSDTSIIASWYITYGVILLVAAILQTIAASLSLFSHSQVIVLFIFFFLFALSVVAFGFLVSTFFSKPRTGAFVAIISFLLLFLISEAFTSSTAENVKTWGCLASPVIMSFGINSLAQAEITSTGITFSNMSTDIQNFRFQTALIFLVIDIILYSLLGYYFEKVIPKDYGVPEPWNFPLRRLLGKPLPKKESLLTDTTTHLIEDVGVDLHAQESNGEALQIQHLRKTFVGDDKIEKVAVAGMSLTLYKDQITCLLGHNGAGKTTLISMLTGMLPSTTGDATMLGGLKLSEDMPAIRQSIGICPQHDVLYDELTVREHLLFYGRLKGCDAAEIDKKIVEVGLTEKRDAFSNQLSGGMKRKLSLAIAFLGDGKIVFLDEPTSGMDPYSRRHSWEIMLNHRPNRIIVLTTHSMDEADILGDRIAILAEGQLRCCGSSLFLKNKYGAGYSLSLIKSSESFDLPTLSTLVNSFVPAAKVLSNVGTEIAYQLPLDAAHAFPALFAALDKSLDKLHVVSYGISVTTLEEVFIKVSESTMETGESTIALDSSVQLHSAFKLHEHPPMNPVQRFTSQFRAMLRKRFLNAKRDRKIVTFSTIWPVIYIAIGIIILKSSSTTKNDPSIVLNTNEFSLGKSTPLPVVCQANDGQWCSSILSMVSTGKPNILSDIVAPVYPTYPPNVFNISYSINTSDTTGFCLRTAQTAFDQGYSQGVEGQFGSYVVHASSADSIVGYNLLVNTTAVHSAPVYKSLLDEALIRHITKNSSLQVSASSHPLPLTKSSKLLSTTILSFTAASFIVVAIAYFSVSIVPYLVAEKHPSHNSKHQQFVSGANIPAFWLANLAWDIILYLVPCILALVAIQAFDITPFTGNDCPTCASTPFSAIVVLFILCGFAVVGFSYILSFFCKEPAEAQSYIASCNIYLGVYLMLINTILSLVPATQSTSKVLVFFFRLSPLFCLGNGMYSLSTRTITNQYSAPPYSSAFAFENAGWEIVYLALEGLLYPLTAMVIDYLLCFPKFMARFSKGPIVEDTTYEVDHDVDTEAQRVKNGDANDIISINSLRKVYKGGKVALVDLSLGLPKGECFGFLGINGAGKTTAMKIMTGDILASSGQAKLSGYDILTQQLEIRRLIGYCPQFDALIDLLTVREHLELFASIKGIPSNEIESVVCEKMHQLNLIPFENKLSKTLSGGNKRKLSVAIALIGGPPILFLDEPSTGMDPVSRRFMWDVISSISTQSKESTIFLTTHSMEECEALCTRVGIMVGGRLRCLGSIQHLKYRFGDGLMLHIKLRPVVSSEVDEMATASSLPEGLITKDDLSSLCTMLGHPDRIHQVSDDHPTGYALADAFNRNGAVHASEVCAWWLREDRFEGCLKGLQSVFGDTNVTIVERHLDVCRIKLTGSPSMLQLSHVFGAIESEKMKLGIQEYTVSQTTLEQIFNSFASQQTQELGVARGVQLA